MPLYRHTETGSEQELAEDAAALFGDLFELIGESPAEARAREVEEARNNKVEFESEDDAVDLGQLELDTDPVGTAPVSTDENEGI